ncbi:diguanylate cyclase [Microseira wollei]|nr:diguanylate cyclase [Microseira wollei]
MNVISPDQGQIVYLPTQRLTPMDGSILVVGGNDFQATILDRLPTVPACDVDVASSPKEAQHLIQAQQPDVLILQASLVGNLELCRQIKQQSSLAWIYCILIADQPENQSEEIVPGWNWELAYRTAALEGGADAFLLLSLQKTEDVLSLTGWKLENHLLQAQIRAGIGRVQIYRSMMRTNDLLSAIALSDPLTELSNRRALDWELPRQIQNARHRATPLSLLILDIDYFKSVNDTYGHLVGDRLLKLLSARLRHNLRFQDTPFRYGGEEFVIILSNTTLEEGQAVAHRLNSLIGKQPFAIDANLALPVTVSIGVATLQPTDDANGVSLINRADQNLLKAKTSGRNQVVAGD